MGKTGPTVVADTEVLTADIDFSNSASEDVQIAITRRIREIVRGRLYIDEDVHEERRT